MKLEGNNSESPHDAHVEAQEKEHKKIFQEHLDLARGKLAQLSSADSVIVSSNKNKFSNFFHSLINEPSQVVGGRAVISNIDEIKILAKQGLDIYYQALKNNLPKVKELQHMSDIARGIANDHMVERAFNSNQPENFITILTDEDYNKLRKLGEFEGGYLDSAEEKEWYAKARKVIEEL
ncbi:MAG: hypothetical protein Q7S34_00785 [bacterium]|nr:hypothetical protein [bacterium]